MKRYALLAAGAAFVIAGPAFAQAQAVPGQPGTVTVIPAPPGQPPAIDAPPGSTIASVIIAPTAPPPPRIETPPPPPSGPREVWTPGHWQWSGNGGAYAWIDGHYRTPPQPTAMWVDGRWVQNANGWEWIDGHWNLRSD